MCMPCEVSNSISSVHSAGNQKIKDDTWNKWSDILCFIVKLHFTIWKLQRQHKAKKGHGWNSLLSWAILCRSIFDDLSQVSFCRGLGWNFFWYGISFLLWLNAACKMSRWFELGSMGTCSSSKYNWNVALNIWSFHSSRLNWLLGFQLLEYWS